MVATGEKPLSDIVVTDHKTMKGRVASWARMKAEDPEITNKEIADKLGISINTLSACLTKGRKEGWLAFEDPLNQIQYDLIPRNVEQMAALQEAGDQKAIIEVFKQLTAPAYRDSQGIRSDTTNNVIAIKIEMPPASEMPVVRGTIVGEARTFKSDGKDDL